LIELTLEFSNNTIEKYNKLRIHIMRANQFFEAGGSRRNRKSKVEELQE
jgi:hypothetical protein